MDEKKEPLGSQGGFGRAGHGICNTWSGRTLCNGHFRELAEFVKPGVCEPG